MAPLKPLAKLPPTGMVMKDGIKTRSQVVPKKKDVFPKRKAEESPLKRLTVKRSAFTELTNVADAKENAVHMVKTKMTTTATLKKPLTISLGTNLVATKSSKPKPAVRVPLADQKNLPNLQPTHREKPPAAPKTAKNNETVAESPKTLLKAPSQVPVAIKQVRKQHIVEHHVHAHQQVGVMTRRSLARKSLDLEKSSDNSLYVSALEDLNLEDGSKSQKTTKKVEKLVKEVERKPPPGVNDYDQEQLKDLFSASNYAMEIFDYLKRREKDFVIDEYFSRQTDLTANMRALLVDWMVEVQENFEINHESLYLGVKLVDLYLSRQIIRKEKLQLVGVTGLFIACKYDERLPPALDDFVYVCDNLYKDTDLTRMEREILRSVNYELGIPLSYRFLRRYSRCGKYDMPLLTLARYILETNLMDHLTISCSDSKMASAALFLALQMKGQQWTKTLVYYSGYKPSEFKDEVLKFNEFLHKPNKHLATVRTKYSHTLFFEVAKTPLVPSDRLNFTVS